MSIKEIAKRSGASVATVSRVLNQPDYVCRDKELQERIWEAARELDYIPNHAAQQLKRGQSAQQAHRQIDVFLTRFQTLEEDIFFKELYEVLREILLQRQCVLHRLLTLPDMISRSKNLSRAHPSDQSPDGLVMLVVVLVLVVMVVFVHMLGLLLPAVDQHGQVGAGDAALHGRLPHILHPGDVQAVEPLHEPVRVRQQLQKGRRQHVAGRAHAAVQIERFHFAASIWLIILARYPAPKPLSMFTTDTPLAQELSMLKRALRP